MNNRPRIQLFTGKGGAGRTTLSAARALQLHESAPAAKVLLLDLERDGALGDVLKRKITTEPTKLPTPKGVKGGIWVAELEPALVAKSVSELSRGIKALAVKGRVLQEDDVRRLLDAALVRPEVWGLAFYLAELSASDEWEQIIVDAPSSVTLIRLLEQPARLRQLVDLLRGVRAGKIPKGPRAAEGSALIERIDAVQAFLKDPTRLAVSVVASAEPVAESQVKELVRELQTRGIAMSELLVNCIEDGQPSREASNRRGLQAPHVRKYQTLHPQVALLARHQRGPKGIEELRKFARTWASGTETQSLAFQPTESPPALVRAPSMPPVAAPAIPPARLIVFMGAGGVGRSTCAAAAAVTLTEKEGPVLLLSADPSHSLSDILQGRVADTESQVRGTKGLYARELNFKGYELAQRKKFREQVIPLFGEEVRNAPPLIDRDLVRNLFDFLPVGMEDWSSLSSLADALKEERFKRIVVDTPKTELSGPHLMKLADTLGAWLDALKGVFSRYRDKGAQAILAWAQAERARVDRFAQALTNPQVCRVVVVARGDELAVPSTERLVQALKGFNLSVERVIVNRVQPKTACEKTEERRKQEQEVAKQLDKRIGLPVTLTPALGRHPAGLRELKGFRTSWYAIAAISKSHKAA